MHRGIGTTSDRQNRRKVSLRGPEKHSSTLLGDFPRRGAIQASDSDSSRSARGECRLMLSTEGYLVRIASVAPDSAGGAHVRVFVPPLTSEEYSPCFRRERRDLAKPSRVRGPVLAPPCIRHRPLCMAGA